MNSNNYNYFPSFPNSLVMTLLWPYFVGPLDKLRTCNEEDFKANIKILMVLSVVNKKWKLLVQSSVEWTAFRLCQVDKDDGEHAISSFFI
jgi:hypothetical protein